jgi:fumarate reductase flavoprotein subunit
LSIIRDNNRQFEVTVPVLIIGAGACGLTAALAARESGVDVLILERDKNPYGSTGMSYGAICAAGSSLQKEAGIMDSAELLYQDIMTVTGGKTRPELARLLAEQSAPTVDWLCEDHEIQLSLDKHWLGMGHRQPRLHAPENHSGETLMNQLLNASEKSAVDLLTEAQVISVIANDQNEVLGVRFRRPDGSEEEVGCSSLILATCGFGANREWVSRFIPQMRTAKYHGHEGNEGDGILWGEALGAETADMGSYQALGSLADPQALVIPHTLLIGGGVQVNVEGKRFENELEDISGQSLTILDQPENVCWMVYDQRLHQAALSQFQDYRDADSINTPKRAESVEQLAGLMKVPEQSLLDTLSEVRNHASLGQDDRFGRSFNPEQELQAPFYAIRVTGALFHTQGGLVVDDHAQVIGKTGETLPNLFAGGGAACSVSGPGGWGYLPAMGLCTAVTLGRLAGYAAADLAKAAASE